MRSRQQIDKYGHSNSDLQDWLHTVVKFDGHPDARGVSRWSGRRKEIASALPVPCRDLHVSRVHQTAEDKQAREKSYDSVQRALRNPFVGTVYYDIPASSTHAQ